MGREGDGTFASMRTRASVSFFVVLAVAIACGCTKGGKIPDGGKCFAGDPESICDDGLVCRGDGKEVRRGDNYVVEGRCEKAK